MTLEPEAITRREAFLRDLVQAAARLAAEGFARQPGRSVSMKGPQDCLTETDGEIEAYLRTRIAEAFPEDGFLGEETGGQPRARTWVVDPIDGTANFARSIPHFCISIAFVADGEVQLGAIANPILDEFYFARRGRGAQLNGRPIRVSPTADIAATSFEVGWSTRRSTEEYIAVVRTLLEAGSNVRRGACGALGLAYVADGRSEGYAELHMNSWDCLAGLLLVREAGGVTSPFLASGLTEGAPVLAANPDMAGILSRASGIALPNGPDLLPGAEPRMSRSA